MHNQEKIIIKIYGERNTGTNYLHKIIHLNLNIELLPGIVPLSVSKLFPGSEIAKDLYFKMTYGQNLGWKHAMVNGFDLLKKMNSRPETLLVITSTKNPYSWLLSLYRRPYHNKIKYISFLDFLTSPWKTVGRENYAGNFDNPIDIWNKKNAAYLKLGDYVQCINCKYEDIIGNPETLIARIADSYSIVRKTEKFQNLDVSAKKSSKKDFSYFRDYYLKEKWKDILNKEAIGIINSSLDFNVMNAFEYDVLT